MKPLKRLRSEEWMCVVYFLLFLAFATFPQLAGWFEHLRQSIPVGHGFAP